MSRIEHMNNGVVINTNNTANAFGIITVDKNPVLVSIKPFSVENDTAVFPRTVVYKGKEYKIAKITTQGGSSVVLPPSGDKALNLTPKSNVKSIPIDREKTMVNLVTYHNKEAHDAIKKGDVVFANQHAAAANVAAKAAAMYNPSSKSSVEAFISSYNINQLAHQAAIKQVGPQIGSQIAALAYKEGTIKSVNTLAQLPGYTNVATHLAKHI